MVSDRLNGIDDIAEVCLFKMISDCWRKPLVHLEVAIVALRTAWSGWEQMVLEPSLEGNLEIIVSTCFEKVLLRRTLTLMLLWKFLDMVRTVSI